MVTSMPEHNSASSHLRVSVACFRWNGESLETVTTPELALPTTVPAAHESLDSAAGRLITTHFAQPAAYIEQLYTFDNVCDDDRETNVTYIALFSPTTSGEFTWVTPDSIPTLPGTTAEVLEYAFTRLRAKLEYTSIAFHLMADTFTLAELQLAYESILGIPLDKRNFRRRMTTSGMLEATGEKRREGPHRPAALYRFSGKTDRSSYLTPSSSAGTGWQESFS